MVLLLTSYTTVAQSVYVIDSYKYTLRTGESHTHKVIDMLKSGTKLTLISTDRKTGYSKVETRSGKIGYIPSRYTQSQPISATLLKKANKEITVLKTENNKIKTTLSELNNNNSTTTVTNRALTKERDQLSKDLNDLRQTASNAIQLKRQRNELQERVVHIERELQQLKRAKQTLEDSTNQDWFLYGGILSFLGIFFGLLIPKLNWQRKHSNNWDTF